MALQMIRESKKLDLTVKFQKRNAEDINFGLTTPKAVGYLSKNISDIPKKKTKFGGWTYPDVRLELKETDYKKIKSFCKN